MFLIAVVVGAAIAGFVLVIFADIPVQVSDPIFFSRTAQSHRQLDDSPSAPPPHPSLRSSTEELKRELSKQVVDSIAVEVAKIKNHTLVSCKQKYLWLLSSHVDSVSREHHRHDSGRVA